MKGLLSYSLLLIALTLMALALPAQAQPAQNQDCKIVNGRTICTIPNPLEDQDAGVAEIIGTAISGLLGLVGAIALFFFFRGGATWLFSAGNSERVKEGAKTMVWAGLGLIVTFGSYITLRKIIELLSGR